MNKTIAIMLGIALLVPGVALAAVSGTPHDVTSAAPGIVTAGICSPCHIPHGAAAGGSRLFPVPPTLVSLNAGDVGNLCGACHSETQGAYRTTVYIFNNAAQDSYVYPAESHARQNVVADYPDVTPALLAASTLPYTTVGSANIECTSCHNVHDNATARPFLRVGINDLCQKCHPNRHWTGAAFEQNVAMGAYNIPSSRTANPGSHPVGTNVDAAMNVATAEVDIGAEFTNAFEAAGAWTAGGKLSDGTAAGGVVCTSCHAVHGAHDDAGSLAFTATEHSPYTNFLVINQASTTITYDTPGTLQRSVASGYGGNNLFCEGCHEGTLTVADYTINESVVGAGVADPGQSGYTHPLDGITITINWTDAFGPASTFEWPLGSTTDYPTGDTTIAICESCHVMHPYANQSTAVVKRPDVLPGAAAFILRDDLTNICNDCHTASSEAHHPSNITYNSAGIGAGGLPFATGAANDTLTCATCHSGAAGGAHNWTGAGNVNIAAAWVPADNARSSVPGTDAVDPQMGQTCFDCHFSAETGSPKAGFSPTLGDGVDITRYPLDTGYTQLGTGSHFLGYIGADDLTATGLNPQLTNVYTALGQSWSAVVAGAGTGWSRFRGGVGTLGIVCESCHELEPDKNAGVNSHLLLAKFYDGNDGNNDGADDGHDNFCEACHYPVGTHPITGDFVDRTNGAVLNIDTGKAWLESIGGTRSALNDVTWSGPNDMSCDSCHQVHDAPDNSYNMILEAQNADLTVVATDGNSYGATENIPVYADGTKGPDHSAFCQYCHAY